jgi:hypothetical protein
MAHHLFAGVAELADALDLGSSVLRRGGSSPFTRTNSFINERFIKLRCAVVAEWQTR